MSSNLIRYAVNTDGIQKRINDICGFHKYVYIPSVDKVLSLLERFTDCVGYANNRRSSPLLPLETEGGVQDMIYLMLKPSIEDLIAEQPVSDKLRQCSIQDFRSKSLRLIIEVKIIRDKSHGKSILKELHDDIGNYKSDSFCDDLIFFLYDPNHFLESPSGIIMQIEGEHTHDNYKLRVHCMIRS
jgi:hypothetical protein